MEIEWRPVKDFEGIYEVSEQGEIRKIGKGQVEYTNKQGISCWYIDQSSYWPHTIFQGIPSITLIAVDGSKHDLLVRNIVADAFLISDKDTYATEVKYKDGDYNHNFPSNLKVIKTEVRKSNVSVKTKVKNDSGIEKASKKSKLFKFIDDESSAPSSKTLKKSSSSKSSEMKSSKRGSLVKDTNTNKVYVSMSAAGKDLGIPTGMISNGIKHNRAVRGHLFIILEKE